MAEESLGWAIWSTAASSIFVFLYAFSVGIAYVSGTYLIHPFVMAALGFLIPYFSFWLLPIVLILLSAAADKNLIT
jgi:hypothetical protein